jgi:hypothetical protein
LGKKDVKISMKNKSLLLLLGKADSKEHRDKSQEPKD